MTTLNAAPFTERQMQIHQRLFELQQQMLALGRRGDGSSGDVVGAVNDEVDAMQIKANIGTLRDFLDSPWATHNTDELPPELQACF